jgi:anti-anti-sigma factor
LNHVSHGSMIVDGLRFADESFRLQSRNTPETGRALKIQRGLKAFLIGEINLSSSIVPYTLKILKSHVEVTFHPPIVEGTWSDIEKLGDEVTREIEHRESPKCLIDLSPLSYMGSSLVAVLVRIWKEVKNNDGRMVIVVSHSIVEETLTLAGLDKIWNLYGDMESAYREIGVPLQNPSTPPANSGHRKVLIGVVVLAVVILGISFFLINQQP